MRVERACAYRAGSKSAHEQVEQHAGRKPRIAAGAAEGRGTASSRALPSRLSELPLGTKRALPASELTRPPHAVAQPIYASENRVRRPRSPQPAGPPLRLPGRRVVACLVAARQPGSGRPRTAGGFRLPSAAVGLSPRDPQHQGFAMHRPPRAIAEGNNGTLGTVDSQEEETQGAGDLRGALLRGARRTRPPRPHAPRARPSHPPRPRAALPAREQKLPGGSRHPPAPTLPPRPPPLQLSRAPGAAKQRRFCDRVTAKWCDIRGGRRSSSRGGRALPGPSATTGRGSARRHRTAPRPSARRDPHER
ncbi:translation initiation factor IF-2-like [Lagopus muta]|uniref:translation initiation factor IF-2-like n=1 Tax=Lagopus muta TaxID=64668 RepID=UPI00209E0A8F|nr:translation initiation factor IF-2-like [Lagopus muta]